MLDKCVDITTFNEANDLSCCKYLNRHHLNKLGNISSKALHLKAYYLMFVQVIRLYYINA